MKNIKNIGRNEEKKLTKFSLLEVPRCHHALGYQAKDIPLYVFTDASGEAYGAVAYLRFDFKIEKSHCSFAMAKN